ncbi:MAG: hypothetical protein KDI46_06190 [Alphaproteobacteria bacterium]|nr:hypothetical protein [Alphaproteobacteria bacterium]
MSVHVEELSATEDARWQKFSVDLDDETARAMRCFFRLTKKGCDRFAYEVMMAAHVSGSRVSQGALVKFRACGIFRPDGSLPDDRALAIRKAVAESYLVMHDMPDLALKPDFRDLTCG